MSRFLLFFTVLFAACSGSTGPRGIDPSVLVVSRTPDTVWVTWGSDAGLTTITVAPYATVCTRWTQSFDSLYVYVRDSVAGEPPHATNTAPWVHFAEYPDYFQVDTVSTGVISNHLASQEC